ncbi:4-hydroxy-tetrahydrodipicolinate synthase [Calidifontibacillus erzurumensis]|uniref:4-hydroxy-tetrahydrodipicolinate synthase n=1 Tax=Calidifontibacillus erzurumensis TaxID=2741433 RepID=A0A8J8K7L1_9BACI|nr:4-hydroxy-tetrahydrodipicolinate synthase [Calidifontibacillus erzurumensis]NSL50871.1 4-hydroxy-tetrahydrodipicolinate synthase [Calidifontibacillus erzurumensis]
MMNFGRILTAMVTPFNERGEVDFTKVEELVHYLIENGTEGLVVAGTTGESPTLTTDEKVALFKQVVKIVNGRIPVIAGTGSNNTYASIELTKKAEQVGVDGVMLVVPYYNKPSQEGLYQHFKAIAQSTSLPVMLYNIPGRSSVNMAPETVIRLSKIENIVSVKEASGNLDAMAKIIEETDDRFSLYSGDDSLTLPVLAIGGVGVVSVASHVIGNEMQTMVQAFLNGDLKEAGAIHRKLLPIMKALFAAPSPAPVKAALQLKGINVGSLRLPLVPLTNEEKSELEKAMEPILQKQKYLSTNFT